MPDNTFGIAEPSATGSYFLGAMEGLDFNFTPEAACFFKSKVIGKIWETLKKEVLQKLPAERLKHIKYIDQKGVHFKDNKKIKTINDKIWRVIKPLFSLDLEQIDDLLPPLKRPEHDIATFEWLKETDDDMQALGAVRIPNTSPPPPPLTARTHLVFQKTKELMQHATASKKEFRKALQGGMLSTSSRQNFQVTHYTDSAHNHIVKEISLGRSDFEGMTFIKGKKQSHLVKNSVNSALSSYSKRIHLFRALVDEKGSMISFLGRVDSEEKAEQAVEGMFNACLHARDGKKKGITENPDGSYEFQMAVQSMMNMRGKQKKKFKQEQEAYQALENKTLIIPNWKWTSDSTEPQEFTVHLKPIPIAANQYNFSSRMEKIAPALWTGEAAANRASKEADELLLELPTPAIATLDIQQQIADTRFLLRKAYSERGHFSTDQILMLRYFLYHLLNIPVITHCMSSKERGPAATSNEVAIHQWLQEGKPIPKDKKGRYAIYKILEEASAKESIANCFYRNTKRLEISQGEKGGKYYKGIIQNPTLERLPDDYLKPYGGKWTYPLIGLLSVIYYPLLLLTAPAAAAYEYRKYKTLDSLHCLRTFWKHVFSLTDKKVLNEELPYTSGELQFLS